MGKGKAAEDGAERVAQNGYHYVKVDGKWRLKHHIVAEEMLGRPLRHNERVHFVGKKTDFSAANIKVVLKGTSSSTRRLAVVEARIDELQAEKADLLAQIARADSASSID